MNSSTILAEGYDFATLQAIFARSEVEIAQLDGAEVIFEPFDPLVTVSSSSVSASSPAPDSAARKKWWQPFSARKQVIQMAPMLTVVVLAMHRPVKANQVRVVSMAPVHHLAQANLGEYVESAARYPILTRAIERGRLAETGRPDPRARTLRNTAEPESLHEVQQISFGRLGDPPAQHVRRPQAR